MKSLLPSLFALGLVSGQTIIPQIADGGGWQTTLVLTNTTATATTVSLTFYQETSAGATAPWSPPFLDATTFTNLALPGGGTLFFHSANTAPNTTVGWAQLIGGSQVSAYAIFTQFVAGRQNQDGTAPAASPTVRVLVPFDNTNGFVTTMAIANPSAASESITVGVQTTHGATYQPSVLSIPAQGHLAFALPSELSVTAGQSGLAEFYSAGGSLSVVALRFNPTGAFTASPVYPVSGTPIIGSTGTSTLPQYSAISIAADAANAVGLSAINLTANTNSAGGYHGTATGATTLASYTANWSTVTATGNTLNFTGLVAGSSSMQSSVNFAGITSGTLTITLTPATGGGNTGTVSGYISLTSSITTVSGSFTGTYTAQP